MNTELIRHPNWEASLVQFISESRNSGTVLDWVNNNCVSWASDCIKAMTGVDLYAPYRGRSNSPREAFKLLKEIGFDSLDEAITSKLIQKPRAFASFGDVVLYPSPPLPIIPGSEGGVMSGARSDGGWHALGMPFAVCIAEPPFCHNLTEQGVVSMLITSDCLVFDVGGALCLQQ